jgi:hypothetical protein
MNTNLGIHIAMESDIPASIGQMVAMMRSSLLWQEYNGPIIIFVDEPFYNWMYENNMEYLYQDIIPIDSGMDKEAVVERIINNAAYDSIFVINLDDFSERSGNGEVFSVRDRIEQKDFVDLQVELLPEEYKKLTWHNTQLQG